MIEPVPSMYVGAIRKEDLTLAKRCKIPVEDVSNTRIVRRIRPSWKPMCDFAERNLFYREHRNAIALLSSFRYMAVTSARGGSDISKAMFVGLSRAASL